jgi:hypothetical protein
VKLVNLSLMSISTLVRAFRLVNASMMAIKFGLATKLLVAVSVGTDKDRFGLDVERDVVYYW